jgi:tRNA-2-methylthio-N6-dimethylallyladenosine synthase
VKRRRNNELLAVQNAICAEKHRSLIGSTVEILVDGRGKKDGQLSGRTPCDRIVVFDGADALIGSFQTMEIVDATPFTLFGKIRQS